MKWSDGTEYEGTWKAGEMKGKGTKRMKGGIELSGNFDGHIVCGKG